MLQNNCTTYSRCIRIQVSHYIAFLAAIFCLFQKYNWGVPVAKLVFSYPEWLCCALPPWNVTSILAQYRKVVKNLHHPLVMQTQFHLRKHKCYFVAWKQICSSIKLTSSFARFSYSECGLRSLRSLIHMRVMSSLASATPSVAYAPFARSLTWAWLVHLLQLLRVWLTLAHSHGRDEAGRECDILVITYTKWLKARAAHNMGNLWQCCNVHKTPPSIAPSLPPSLRSCLLTCLPAERLTDRPTYWPTYTYSTYLEGGTGSKFLS